MRYDTFIRKMNAATDKYESAVRNLIAAAARSDQAVEAAILRKPGKRSYNGKHWTQTPAGRKKMRDIQLRKEKG